MAQELSKQGSIDSGRRPSGNHLDRILESESFQQTAVLLAGSDSELSSPMAQSEESGEDDDDQDVEEDSDAVEDAQAGSAAQRDGD